VRSLNRGVVKPAMTWFEMGCCSRVFDLHARKCFTQHRRVTYMRTYDPAHVVMSVVLLGGAHMQHDTIRRYGDGMRMACG